MKFTVADSPKGSRRRSKRIDIKLGGTLAGPRRRQVAVVDLSRTGCLVQCDNLLDHGAILDLDIALEPEPFRAKVRVTEAYVDGTAAPPDAPRYLAGLEFVGLGAGEAARLRRFLDHERRRRRGADARAE